MMTFVDRTVIESFNFGSKEPITIIAPALRQTRPVIHSLEASIGHDGSTYGFLFSKTKSQLERWNFPQEPGFFHQMCFRFVHLHKSPLPQRFELSPL